MKMVKSLLLGTAAGLVAVAGAQAADMPVKAGAAPVQYVRICTLYGDGYYYVPGTQTCLKLGGYVRIQGEWNAGGGGVPDGWFIGGQQLQAMYDRVRTNNFDFRVRGALSIDVRDQTDWGTLRSYMRIGVNQTTPTDGQGGSVFWDRAFIQWAGFTVGKAQSFYDTVTYGGAYSYHNVRTVSDTGASGYNVFAYTAHFGNGISGTLSLEDPNRATVVIDNTCPRFLAFPFGVSPNTGHQSNSNCIDTTGAVSAGNAPIAQPAVLNGFRNPDIIGNLRMDQSWGYVALGLAAHNVAGGYYLTQGPGPASGDNVNNGHPPERWGWAASLGALIRIQGGHTFGINGQYSVGAAGYGAATGTAFSMLTPGDYGTWGFAFDGIFDGLHHEIELTTVWNIIAFFEYRWNPRWKTSWFGGYVQIEYSDRQKDLLNPVAVCNGLAPNANPFNRVTLLPGNSCDPDWSFWQFGTRTQWNPHPNLDIGVEVMYTHVNTAYAGPALVNPQVPQQIVDRLDDKSFWSAFFRWQRNFYP